MPKPSWIDSRYMTLFSKSLRNLSLIAVFAIAFIPLRPVSAIETLAKEVVLMDMETGAILLDIDADKPMPPASMSKLMTVFMVFERLRDGRLSLDDTFLVSENAWRKGGAKSGSSTMFLVPGKRVRVEDLIRGIVVQSGNDACIVVAEGISGTEEAFAEEMTERAKQLGLKNSTFRNSTGWPNPDHRMSPKDLALLAKLMIEQFPEYYHYFSERSFVYNGIKQNNRNPLIYKDMGADGLKTGHTEESGYGLASSATQGDRRLILVVNGLPTKKDRSREPERLLMWGFREFDNYKLFSPGEQVEEAEVWLGTEPTVPLIIENELKLTMHKKGRREMKVTVNYQSPLPAPVKKGDKLAMLKVTAPGEKTVEVPLVAAADVERLGLVGRLIAAFKYILLGGSG